MVAIVAANSTKVGINIAAAEDVVLSVEFRADAALLSSFVGVTLSPTFVRDDWCLYELAFLPLHTGCATEHSKTVTAVNRFKDAHTNS